MTGGALFCCHYDAQPQAGRAAAIAHGLAHINIIAHGQSGHCLRPIVHNKSARGLRFLCFQGREQEPGDLRLGHFSSCELNRYDADRVLKRDLCVWHHDGFEFEQVLCGLA